MLQAALLTVAAIGVFAVTAQAEGPFYSKCGKKEGAKCIEYVRLKKGQTSALASIGGAVVIETTIQKLQCTSSKTAAGAQLTGSEPGTAGSSEQVIEI